MMRFEEAISHKICQCRDRRTGQAAGATQSQDEPGTGRGLLFIRSLLGCHFHQGQFSFLLPPKLSVPPHKVSMSWLPPKPWHIDSSDGQSTGTQAELQTAKATISAGRPQDRHRLLTAPRHCCKRRGPYFTNAHGTHSEVAAIANSHLICQDRSGQIGVHRPNPLPPSVHDNGRGEPHSHFLVLLRQIATTLVA